MLINGLLHTVFNITSCDFEVQAADITNYDDWLRNALTPTIVGRKESYKKVLLSCFFRGLTKQAVMESISNLIIALEHCTLQPDRTEFYYDCILVTTNIKKYDGTQQMLEVELKAAYAYKPAITEAMHNITSKAITVPGNLATPAVVTITPTIDTVSVALTGMSKNPIIVNNLHANTPVVIDGEKCTVTEDDIDKNITLITGANRWNFRKYNVSSFANPDDTDIHIAPTYANIPAGASFTQQLITDGAQLVKDIGYDYLGHLKTAIAVQTNKTISFHFYHDDGATIYLNGEIVYTCNHHENEDNGSGFVTLNLLAGWNTIEFIWIQHYGSDGIWGITPAIISQVDYLNCYYSRTGFSGDPEDPITFQVVNKFVDTDMWSFPILQPGANEISLNNTNCIVDVAYKPKYI
jgi:phage-related protein